jgi:monoamine oxidase
VRSRFGEALDPIAAKQAIVALPLGVLKSDQVRFDPALPDEWQRALDHVEMGPVVKVSCRFRRAFWEHRKVPSAAGGTTLSDVVFLHGTPDLRWRRGGRCCRCACRCSSAGPGGPAAAKLSNLDERGIESAAVESLAALLGMGRAEVASELEACRTWDWQRDPFARGAYSYVTVGGADAMKTLAAPINDTLFFAGEHTHWEGMSGTVAGAIGSGQRAAREVLGKPKRDHEDTGACSVTRRCRGFSVAALRIRQAPRGSLGTNWSSVTGCLPPTRCTTSVT